MITKNTLITTDMLHADMQNMDGKSILFFKIRISCLILATIDLAEDPETSWTEEDTYQLEQAKAYLSFLVQVEKIDCKINYNHDFAQTLKKHSTKLTYVICQMLSNHLEKFLKIPNEKIFEDVYHCGNVFKDYINLLDTIGTTVFLNEDDENIHIQRALRLFSEARNQICQQLLYAYESLDQLLKAPVKELNSLSVIWIMETCLEDFDEILQSDLGLWLYERLLKTCLHLSQILPEPDFKNLNDVERQMSFEIVTQQESRKTINQCDNDGCDDDDCVDCNDFDDDKLPF